jgi:hypothetical protein
MRSISSLGLLALTATGLAACDSAETPPAGAEQAAAPAWAPPYKPVASVLDLMRGTVTLAAEDYWSSVSILVDADGVTENQPQTDDEWLEVWSAAITLAESGNLLMMPPRGRNEPEWIRLSQNMIDVGLAAAQVALDKDFEGVLEHGEYVYNTCVECHQVYVPTLPDL